MGYSGGKEPDPTYQSIKDYTEALLIEYNPEILPYSKILSLWSEMDYPYVPQKTQYKSAVWYLNESQERTAKAFVADLEKKYSGKGKLYVDIEHVTAFYRAEEYHQNFMEKQSKGMAFGSW